MPLFLLLLLLFPFTIHAEELPALGEKAEKLYKIGEYDDSIALFDECYQDTHNHLCIYQALNIVESTFSDFPKITKHSLTEFTPANKDTIFSDVWDFIVSPDEYIFKTFKSVLSPNSYKDIKTLPLILPDAKKQISDPENIKTITAFLPFFKVWTQKLSTMARNCYARDNQEICLDYIKNLSVLRKNLDKYYRDFFSYELASPILARTQELIYKADASKTFGVDENILRDAAKLMGTLNDEIFLYVNQDVRNQFLDVYRELKYKAGRNKLRKSRRLTQCKTNFSITDIQNQCSNSPRIGAIDAHFYAIAFAISIYPACGRFAPIGSESRKVICHWRVWRINRSL